MVDTHQILLQIFISYKEVYTRHFEMATVSNIFYRIFIVPDTFYCVFIYILAPIVLRPFFTCVNRLLKHLKRIQNKFSLGFVI